MLVYELVLRKMHKLNTTKVQTACEAILITDKTKLINALKKETKKEHDLKWQPILDLYDKGNRNSRNVKNIIRVIDAASSKTNLRPGDALKKIIDNEPDMKRIILKREGYKDQIINNVKTLMNQFRVAEIAAENRTDYPHLYQRAKILKASLKRPEAHLENSKVPGN